MATSRSIFELKKQWEENNELAATIVDMSTESVVDPGNANSFHSCQKTEPVRCVDRVKARILIS